MGLSARKSASGEAIFSERILRITKPQQLHLVDAWRPYADKRHNRAEFDSLVEAVRLRFAGEPRVVLYRTTSEEFLRNQVPASFDWIYIDAIIPLKRC